MDYCSSCRRHLNGALVCPGCGAYAPDIDPSADDGRTDPLPPGAAVTPAPAPGGPATWEYPSATGTWHDGDVWGETRPGGEAVHAASTGGFAGHDAPHTGSDDACATPDTDVSDGYEARPQGRAARRRQMARWKKNQRRAVVATAVALVGGGLTVTAMNGNASPGVKAATVPEDTTMGGADGQAPTYTEPTSTRHETRRSPSTPTTPPQAERASRSQQSRAADPRTATPDTRTDAAAAPRALPKTTPRQQTTVPSAVDTVTDSTGTSTSTVTEQTPPPATGTSTDTQPAAPAPAASPTPAATPPADSKELCLLVICLG